LSYLSSISYLREKYFHGNSDSNTVTSGVGVAQHGAAGGACWSNLFHGKRLIKILVREELADILALLGISQDVCATAILLLSLASIYEFSVHISARCSKRSSKPPPM